LIVKSFLNKYPDGIILFYDSEFGTPLSYFGAYSIPSDHVVHSPVTTVEELRHDISVQLADLKREDNVLIFLDSLGNLASAKETKDAEEGKEKSDMTRAKTIKSLFRIIVPKIAMKNIPMVVVNHTYETMDLFPKQIAGGGKGAYYGANDIWFMGRRQEKDGDELAGYNFVINIEKSRSVKEKSKIPVLVTHEHGINRWSGLFDLAIEYGLLVKAEKKGYYTHVDPETGEVLSVKDMKEDHYIDNAEFWNAMLKTGFAAWIESKYKLGAAGDIMDNE